MALNSSPIKKYCFTVNENEGHFRLDQAISKHMQDMSREKAKKIIQIGGAWVNDRRVQILSRKVFNGDTITVYTGRGGLKKSYEIELDNILYEDEWLIFYRKEPGIPTQGLICDNYNNLYSALIRYMKKKHGPAYVGMHHRLDMETSGVVLFTLSRKINRNIHYQFKTRRVKKKYFALVRGKPEFQNKTLTTYIRRQDGKYICSDKGPGKISTTVFTRAGDFTGFSLMRAEPETGRTHQIRLQLAFLGLPVLGDRLYGDRDAKDFPRTMLHAESLTVFHPIHKKEITFTAAPFDDMKKLVCLP